MPRTRKWRIMAGGLFLGLILSVLFTSCSKREQVQYQKKIDGISITMSSGKRGFVKGKNDVIVTVEDASRKPLKDQLVEVRFYTPASPGKLSYDISAPAAPRDGAYQMLADFLVAGEWNAEVTVRGPGLPSPQIMAAFKIEVE